MVSYKGEGYIAGDERVIDFGKFGKFSLEYIRGKLECVGDLERDLRDLDNARKVTREILDLEFVV